MRSIRSYLFLLLSACLLMSCSGEDNDIDLTGIYPYQNSPFPEDADTLKVLVLGNSFTENSLRYLDAMVDSASLDRRRLCIYNKTLDGSSIDVWKKELESNEVVDIEKVAGDVKMQSHGEILSLINQNWDVIVFTQVSSYSYKWSSFANLPTFIKLVSENCGNKNVCLMYNLPWVHTPKDMPKMLDGNIECYERMKLQCGIDELIPAGTAVQLARSTRLNDALYLTSDKWHLNDGIGKYIASCTWFQKLITPVFDTDIIGNKARPNGDYSKDDIRLAQLCAKKASLYPLIYNTTVE